MRGVSRRPVIFLPGSKRKNGKTGRISVTIRRAAPEDAPLLLSLIDALADYEKLPRPDAAARERIVHDGFGATPRFQAYFAELEGRTDFVFLFLEIEPPYSVVPVRIDGALKEIGRLRWNQAVEKWGECLANNRWPSYCDGPIILNAPAYVMNQYLGNEQ